jgi:hypothetical protein
VLQHEMMIRTSVEVPSAGTGEDGQQIWWQRGLEHGWQSWEFKIRRIQGANFAVIALYILWGGGLANWYIGYRNALLKFVHLFVFSFCSLYFSFPRYMAFRFWGWRWRWVVLCRGNISIEIRVLLTLEMLVEHRMCHLFIHSFYFFIYAYQFFY